ncbi:PHP domain-containing protein [Frisingicoccus sp.]|uniref:PHP domain-containing protein n=1 Tax=Frisingicoccus sp. TaxID=1918627 RepID=UPI002EAD4B76|nr:PHP domain-containing protein [Frisingicoccus sp.]
MERIDLHTHSTASDGSLSPSEVIQAAASAGLKAVALTDHDTIQGVPEAMAAAEKLHIECIPGIELSAFYKGLEVHIVGLFLNVEDPVLKERLDAFRNIRENRNNQMIEKMQASGVDITMKKLRDLEGDTVITRANIARYLIRIGFVDSVKEAFDKYLSPGMPFFVPKTGVTPKDAIETIRDNDGIAILAHPLTYKFTRDELIECIETLKSYGLQGMETYYSTFSEADHRDMKRLADQYGLLHSGGSDFHGNVKPHIQIGKGMGRLVIPYDVLENLCAHIK